MTCILWRTKKTITCSLRETRSHSSTLTSRTNKEKYFYTSYWPKTNCFISETLENLIDFFRSRRISYWLLLIYLDGESENFHWVGNDNNNDRMNFLFYDKGHPFFFRCSTRLINLYESLLVEWHSFLFTPVIHVIWERQRNEWRKEKRKTSRWNERTKSLMFVDIAIILID